MFVRSVLGIVALTVSSVSFAATQTWNFVNGGDSVTQGGDSSGYGNFINFNRNGVNLNVSAWSETINDSSFCTNNPSAPECSGSNNSGSTQLDPFIDTARLEYYGNTLGIANQDGEGGAPQHSIDNIPNCNCNSYNDYDMVLLQFDEAVNLTQINIGWATNNGSSSSNGMADMSVVAYTGNTDLGGSPFFANTDTWGGLLNNNWSSIGNYQNVNQTLSVTSGVYSKYWLVGAYNPIFGGNLSNANDGFKLAGVSTQTQNTPPPQVPEPSSIALILLGAGLLWRRRA